MPLCARCKHEQYFHAPSETRCQVMLVKWESDWYEVEIAGFKAITMDVEYSHQCPCEYFTLTLSSKSEPSSSSTPSSISTGRQTTLI